MKYKILGLIFLFIFCYLYFPPSVAADPSCNVSVSPTSITAGTGGTFTFTLYNYSSGYYNWIKIIAPNSSYTVTGGSSGGWTASNTSSEVTFTGGSLENQGANLFGYTPGSFDVSVTANSQSASASWTVETSLDGGGSFVSCDGSPSTSISAPSFTSTPTPSPAPSSSPTPTPTPIQYPVISNITVSDVTSSSVNIAWTTDKLATSVIDYGTTVLYGFSKSDSTLVTSHSITISSLDANKTYHYNVISVDSSGNLTSSGDNTFVAAQAAATATTTVTVTNTVTVTPSPTPTPIPDRTPPTVYIKTDLSKPFAQPPQISGTSKDDTAVSKIEYSLDGGQNWLPVDNLYSPGKPSTNFDFIPPPLDDGNYDLLIRAYDSSNNVGLSKKQTLVIDRIPPQISGILFSAGPLVVNPRIDGSILIPAGQDIKITASQVGGATSIDMFADNLKDKTSVKFPAVKNTDNDLWSVNINLPQGEYQLRFSAIDGAGNKTDRNLNKIIAVAKGEVLSSEQPVTNAKLTVYYREPSGNQWQIWDGNSYGQNNPLTTDSKGNYNLFLPPGEFYIHIDAYGYQPLDSEFFTIDKAEPVNADFVLNPSKLLISLGPIKIYYPDFSSLLVPFVNNLPENLDTNALIGQQIPYFSLPGFTSESLTGKPSILTFVNTWSPASLEQIPVLNDFSRNKDFNTAVIVEGEKASVVYVFAQRGGYTLPLVSDQDSILAVPYNLSSLPVSYIADRKGIIRKIISGTISSGELANILNNIQQ